MKHTPARPSATSLRTSPEADAARRSKNYLLMMGIRIACFVLMVVIMPYGWYTAVFGLAAIFLPYVAVVLANVGEDVHEPEPEHPEYAVTEKPSPRPESTPTVIQVHETRIVEPPRSDEA